MAKWDTIYCELCEEILKNGVQVHNRTGIDTIKIPSTHFQLDVGEEFPILTTKQLFIRQAVLEMLWIYQAQSNDVRYTIKIPSTHFQLDVGEEFPILTTKQLFIRQAVLEMLWIYQAQSNDVRWLQERNVHIWDLWEINEDGDWIDEKTGKVLKHFDPKYAHTIGTAYGYIVKHFHLIDKLIDRLKNDTTDRRLVISLWQDDYLDTAVLPSCVWSSEWDVTDGTLNAWVHQRSCDVPLGLPFNVTQYAVLLRLLAQVTGLKPGKLDWSIKDAHIYVNQVEGIQELGLPFNVTQYAVLLRLLAQVTGLKPGKLDWSIKDAHIYVNQVEGIQEQLKRYHEQGSLPAPILWINPEINDFYAFDSSKECKDIKLVNYQHMGKIQFPLAQ